MTLWLLAALISLEVQLKASPEVARRDFLEQAQNAENMLVIHNQALADQYSTYIDELVTQYK